jgi:hypothetical protein
MPHIRFEIPLSESEIVIKTEDRLQDIARVCGKRTAWLTYWGSAGFNIELGENPGNEPLAVLSVHGPYAPAFEAYGLLSDNQRSVWLCPPSTGHSGLSYDRELDPSDEAMTSVASILAEAFGGDVTD